MRISVKEQVRNARMSRQLRLREAGELVGRSGQWVSQVEDGTIAIGAEDAQKLLAAIERYVKLRAEHHEAVEQIKRDFRLPQRTSAMAAVTI